MIVYIANQIVLLYDVMIVVAQRHFVQCVPLQNPEPLFSVRVVLPSVLAKSGYAMIIYVTIYTVVMCVNRMYV